MPKLIVGPIKDPITAEEVKPRPLRPPRRQPAEHDFDRGEPQRIPSGDGPLVEQSPPTQKALTTGPEPSRPIKFDSYTPMVDPSLPGIFNKLHPPDPSGADSRNGVILYVGNPYLVASTDGGASFTDHDPTAFLPAANGRPVDPVMIYVPHRDLFCWMLQQNPSATSGEGHFRLAVYHSSDIAGDVEQGWTVYNFSSSDLGSPGVATDRQDLAYSESRLYMTTNLVGKGRVVMSLALDELDQRQPVTDWSYTHPLDTRYHFSDLAQQNRLNVHMAAIESTTSLEVMTFDDGTGSYGFHSVAVGQFPDDADDLKSLDPDGVDWLTLGVAHVSAALVDDHSLWVAWDAAASAPGEAPVYPNAHVRIARISTDNWTVIEERQVWNPDYAFAYGTLARTNGEVGYGVGVGGSNDYPNSCFGILGDLVVYFRDTSTSTAGAPSDARWGDYITVRPSTVDPRRFAAFGYYTDGVGNAWKQRPFHLSYGRP